MNYYSKSEHMPRPRRHRSVRFQPDVTFFKPSGVEMRDLEESILTVDELEAVRLKDYENLDQEKAAEKMNISQPTFHRTLLSARQKIADALVNGKALRIEGGVYKMVGPGRGRGQGGGRGAGRGRQPGGFGMGPGGECVCTNSDCKHLVSHPRGTPCYQMKCPKCGSPMIRKR
jgi:predicted DNA-binding protein (UPF0251 family)